MKKLALVIGVILLSLVLTLTISASANNKRMAISRQSSAYFSNTFTTPTFTHSAYNPGYGGTERGRMIILAIRTAGIGGSTALITSVTYGGITMRPYRAVIAGGFVSQGFYWIQNPPTGAQDIVVAASGTNRSIKYALIAYESDTDSSF